MGDVKKEISDYFWNEKTGRFHMGYDQQDPNHLGSVSFPVHEVLQGSAMSLGVQHLMDGIDQCALYIQWWLSVWRHLVQEPRDN